MSLHSKIPGRFQRNAIALASLLLFTGMLSGLSYWILLLTAASSLLSYAEGVWYNRGKKSIAMPGGLGRKPFPGEPCERAENLIRSRRWQPGGYTSASGMPRPNIIGRGKPRPFTFFLQNHYRCML